MNALQIPSDLELDVTREQFEQLAIANRDLKLERTAAGRLMIVPPTGGTTGRKNLDIAAQLWWWNCKHQLGVAFDSSTGFHLPNGADCSPDAAWIARSRWDTLATEQQDSFVPLCPDFVVELRSRSDRLSSVQAKMREYRDNGGSLGWLIEDTRQTVGIYRKTWV